MPNRETRRKAQKDKVERPDPIKLKDPSTGKVHSLDFMELSAADEMVFYTVTGLLITQIAEMMGRGQVPLFGFAGLLFVVRRRKEPDLSFESVAESITVGGLEDLIVSEPEPEPESPPED